MDNIIPSVVALSLVLGIIFSLSHPTQKPLLGSVSAILFTSAILPSLLSLISGAVSLPEFKPSLPGVDGTAEYTEDKYTEAIIDYLCSEFDIPDGEITLDCEGFRLDVLRFESVSVRLSGSAVFIDTTLLRATVLDEFVLEGGTASVQLDFG